MKIIFVGGGLSGLGAGFRLACKGFEVIILEKEKQVGGLARTLQKDGFRYDIGGHRFWTKNQTIENLVKDLLKDEIISVRRFSRVYFHDYYFNYPLKFFDALRGLGFTKSLKSGLSYGLEKINNLLQEKKIVSFEDWGRSQFGWEIYNTFFKTYTEKLWGIPCSELSADWADQRIRGVNIKAIVKKFLFRGKTPKSFIEEFLYPKYGIGRIAERLAEEIKKAGGKIVLGAEVKKILVQNNKIKAVVLGGDRIIEGDKFIFSLPITKLIDILDVGIPQEIIAARKNLNFRSWIGINLVTKQKRYTPDNWIYIHDPEIIFSRIQQWANWSNELLKNNWGLITLEIFTNKNDKVWCLDERDLIKWATADLVEKLKLLPAQDIVDGWILKVTDAYPIYQIGYKKHLQVVKNYLKKFENLQMIGRLGLFKYNNMDQAIEMGFLAAGNLMGEKKDLDSVGQEKEYLEASET